MVGRDSGATLNDRPRDPSMIPPVIPSVINDQAAVR